MEEQQTAVRNIVIIGGVAAGLKSAAKVRRGDPRAKITVIERGDIVSYGACGMPYVVSGNVDSIDHLMMTPNGSMRNPSFFKATKNLDILTKTEALRIDRTAKTVRVKDLPTSAESDIPYDKLVIATGSTPVRIPFPGVELGNIFPMWHPYDAQAIRDLLEGRQVKNAVIIGAGLVGIEMAEAFHRWGVHTTIVEMQDHVFPAFLDPEVALSVEKYAQGKGIAIRMQEKVQRFEGKDVVNTVVTDKGTYPADVVILSVGVKPTIALAREAGLEIGVSGAIQVDKHMLTSDPDIYAGGDCAENTHMVSGKKMFVALGSIANKHGRVIGENICGADVKFRGILGTVVVRLLELNVGKTGLTETEAKAAGYEIVTTMTTGNDRAHYMPESKLLTIKLIADAHSRKVLGIQAFGEGDVAKRIDVVAAVLTFGGTIDDLFDVDLSYAPPFNNPIDNAAVAANTLMNKIAGKFKGISTVEAKEKLASTKTVFLDVRSPEECKAVRIASCRNVTYIPLGQLRSRMAELGKEDEIVAFCKISLRGYEAECMLEGEGFKDVKVLEGGVVAWPFECEVDDSQPMSGELPTEK
jgi:NADPH-dependent 2,4-dienoyl-CoA reductase/sulfur reductase-like enzyme/rhodanese-related sulfurtransferase